MGGLSYQSGANRPNMLASSHSYVKSQSNWVHSFLCNTQDGHVLKTDFFGQNLGADTNNVFVISYKGTRCMYDVCSMGV